MVPSTPAVGGGGGGVRAPGPRASAAAPSLSAYRHGGPTAATLQHSGGAAGGGWRPNCVRVTASAARKCRCLESQKSTRPDGAPAPPGNRSGREAVAPPARPPPTHFVPAAHPPSPPPPQTGTRTPARADPHTGGGVGATHSSPTGGA